MRKWFKDASTIEELKKAYRVLTKKYHPDLNKEKDTTKEMKEINNEYEYLFGILKHETPKEEGKEQNHNHNVNDGYRDMMDILVTFDESITIEIVGSWVWAFGKGSYHVKDRLKELGFQWSSKHKKWYFTTQELKGKKGYTNKKSYEEIKNTFGWEKVNNKGNVKIS